MCIRDRFLHRAKNTQDKIGYHLLRGDYARAIGDTKLEEQERLLSEQLKKMCIRDRLWSCLSNELPVYPGQCCPDHHEGYDCKNRSPVPNPIPASAYTEDVYKRQEQHTVENDRTSHF